MSARRAAIQMLAITFFLDVSMAQIVKRTWAGWHVFMPASNPRAPSPIYHHGLRPMMDVTHQEWGRRYRFATNSLGMVDASPRVIDPKDDRCRILFIGDSMTEGYGVGWDKSYAGILSKRWKDQGIEVLNAAVAGSSPSIYYRKVRHLIEDAGLRFNALFVAIDISDIRDEWMNYDLDERESVVQISTEFPAMTMRAPTTMDRIVYTVIDNSVTARLTYRALVQAGLWPSYQTKDAPEAPPIDLRPHRPPLPLPLGALSIDRIPNGGVDRLPGHFPLKYGYWTLDPNDWRDFGKDGLQVAAERMDRLVLLLRRHNIRLTVTVHPWPTNLAAKDEDSLQVRFWREWARTRGAAFLELFSAFLRAGPDVIKSHYIEGDLHWNERGNALTAEEISRQFDPRSACPALSKR